VRPKEWKIKTLLPSASSVGSPCRAFHGPVYQPLTVVRGPVVFRVLRRWERATIYSCRDSGILPAAMFTKGTSWHIRHSSIPKLRWVSTLGPKLGSLRCTVPSTKMKIVQKLSCRVSQRRLNRKKRNEKEKDNTQLAQLNYHTKQRCLSKFGLFANPKLNLWSNFNIALNTATTPPLSKQPSNLSFHNLCSTNKIPLGTRQLLGLILNFCLASSKLQNNIKEKRNNAQNGLLYPDKTLA
jgi:hypothetical protein